MNLYAARMPAYSRMGHIWPLTVLATFLAFTYWGSLSNGFVYDDIALIVENMAIKSPANLKLLFHRGYFLNFSEDSYRPYVTFSYFIDWWLWGLNPLGYHVTNLIYHAGASIAAYILLFLVLRDKIVAFFSSLIFTIHPVSTEAVAAIGFREDLQATFFYFIAFASYAAKEGWPRAAGIDPVVRSKGIGLALLLISVVSFAAALASKESALSLPFALAFFRLAYPPGRPRPAGFKSFLRSIAPYFAMAAVYAFIRFHLMVNPDLRPSQYPGGSFYTNFLTMSKVVAFYVLVLFLPVALNGDYDFAAAQNFLRPGPFFSIALIAAILFVAASLREKRFLALFAAGWFFITLAPVYNLVPLANIAALRYLYLPSLGFSAALGLFLKEAIEAQKVRRARIIAICLTVSLGASLALGARSRAGVWASDQRLWADTVSKSPAKARPQANLGYTMQTKRALDKAIAQYKISLSLRPDFHSTWFNLGNAFKDKGQIAQAIISYENSIRIDPAHGRAHNNLGALFYRAGEVDKGISMFKDGLRLNPYMADPWFNLGNALRDKGRPRQSVENYRQALRLDPYMVDSMNNLGLVLLSLGELEEAELVLWRALSIKPTFEEAHLNLGAIYAKKGAHNRAIAQYKAGLQIRPDYSKLSFNLGVAFEELGLKAEAARYYQLFIDSWRGGPEFLRLAREKLARLRGGR